MKIIILEELYNRLGIISVLYQTDEDEFRFISSCEKALIEFPTQVNFTCAQLRALARNSVIIARK